jgi:hypothetical protein
MLSLGVKDSYAVEKEALWRRADVSLSRLRANTAALAEELHMDAKQARVRSMPWRHQHDSDRMILAFWSTAMLFCMPCAPPRTKWC